MKTNERICENTIGQKMSAPIMLNSEAEEP